MIILYNSNETDFNNNGLGILREAYEAYINRKLNSIYELTFKYPTAGKFINNLNEFMIVKADGQLFRIKNISKKRLFYEITANHIFYDLNNNFLEDVAPTKLNGSGALNWILNRTLNPHRFTAYSNVQTINSARYVRKNVINAIIGADNSIVKRWNAEIDVDNFQIKLLTQIGENRGLFLSINKNISSANVSVNIDNLATKLMPIGKDGLLLPEKYVDSPLINNYPIIAVRTIDVKDAEVSENMTEEEAYTLMRQTCVNQYNNGIDKPVVNIKVNFVELSKTEEYKNFKNLETVYLGDTVSVFLEKYGVTSSVRVISTKKNVLTGKYEKLELGDQKKDLASTELQTIKAMENLENDNEGLLDEAIAMATQLIASAMGGYVVKTRNEILIMDTDNTATATEVWRWNLNGFGHSSTGVNGPYETAITQDGRIVANFITAGTMSMERIEGLSSIIAEINTMASYKRKVEGITQVHLQNAVNDKILSLNIQGNRTYESNLFPATNLYPNSNLQPNMRR